jgi:hypothetical protein
MTTNRSSPGLGEGEQDSGGSDVRLTLPARPENVLEIEQAPSSGSLLRMSFLRSPRHMELA